MGRKRIGVIKHMLQGQWCSGCHNKFGYRFGVVVIHIPGFQPERMRTFCQSGIRKIDLTALEGVDIRRVEIIEYDTASYIAIQDSHQVMPDAISYHTYSTAVKECGSKKSDQTIAGSLRYFSLGDITFTDITGATIGQFRPYEMALDMAYARKLSKNFSVGLAGRYIYSNLTNGIDVGGANTHAAQTGAVDLSVFYTNDKVKVGDKKSILNLGLDISNIGGKVAYTNSAQRDFIPTNLRVGGGLTMELDKYNSLSFIMDINKLLVPTPDIVDTVNHKTYGKPTNVPVATGILYGLDPSDPPGGTTEYLREFDICGGMEYWYDKLFAVRAGYFYENPTKGNRKYFTLGAGIKYSVFTLDFAYLIPTDQRNPLQNTLRFTLVFDFDALKDQNKESSGTSTN